MSDSRAASSSSTIIAVATMKGGSGKTTLAVCVAGEWLYRGVATAMIDTDAQQSARRWAYAGSHLELMPVEVNDVEDQLGLTRRVRRFVDSGFHRIVIDTPGFASPVLDASLAIADLVIVPVKPSPVDYQVAADTMDLVQSVAASRPPERPLKAAMVMTQVQPRTVLARHMRQQLLDAGYPLTTSQLDQRVAYAEAPFTGSTPGIGDPRSSAAREISALTDELDRLLQR